MMEVGVKPAPGDSDTVAFVNSRVSEGISRRRLKRDGAVTVFRPGMDDYDGISIPVARAPTPRTSAPAGLGKAAANVAPPPPPKGIGIVVSPSATRDVDQPEIPTVMERGDKFIVKATQPVRTRKLTPQRPTAGKRIGADDNKSMYLEDED